MILYCEKCDSVGCENCQHAPQQYEESIIDTRIEDVPTLLDGPRICQRCLGYLSNCVCFNKR